MDKLQIAKLKRRVRKLESTLIKFNQIRNKNLYDDQQTSLETMVEKNEWKAE